MDMENTDELTALREKLRSQRPVAWDQLPDFPLYMDQVLSYMERQVFRFEEGDGLTAAMVNNYTKSGLVPRAEGKKYTREHLAYLTAISAMKQVLSVREMRTLVAIGQEGRDCRRLYDFFCASLDRALNETAGQLPDETDRRDLPKLVLDLALRSYANALACREVLRILAGQEGCADLLEQKK